MNRRCGPLAVAGPSQLVMLWSSDARDARLLAVVRAQALEPLFGGLGTAVRLHRRLGLAALVGMSLHALLLTADALAHGLPAARCSRRSRGRVRARSTSCLLRPDRAGHPRVRQAPAATSAGWRCIASPGCCSWWDAARVHRAGHDPQLRAAANLDRAPAARRRRAWAYRVFLFRRFGPRYRYQVEAVALCGPQTVDLIMRPLERRMMYEPGTFVFIGVPSFRGKEGELHPFSISSSPLDRDLRVSIRQVGDFTRKSRRCRSARRTRISGHRGAPAATTRSRPCAAPTSKSTGRSASSLRTASSSTSGWSGSGPGSGSRRS